MRVIVTTRTQTGMSSDHRNRQPRGVSTGGQFATGARSEADGVALGRNEPMVRPANEVIASPLSLREVGRRLDDEGRFSALVALRPYQMNTDDERTADDLAERLMGEYHFAVSDIRVKPISVTEDHQVICELSADALLIRSFLTGSDESQFQQGSDEVRLDPPAPFETAIDRTRHVDGAAFLAPSGELESVPQLPRGFENPEIEFGYQKHTGDPEVRFSWGQGTIHHQPSVDGYTDSATEDDFTGIDSETVDELRDYAWCVGKNFITLRDDATARLMKSEGFQDRMRELATAGGKVD